jgi:hypothetical protein
MHLRSLMYRCLKCELAMGMGCKLYATIAARSFGIFVTAYHLHLTKNLIQVDCKVRSVYIEAK